MRKMLFLSNPLFFTFLFVIKVNTLQSQTPELVEPVPHTSFVDNARFSNNGRLVATAAQDHTAKVWDVFTGQLLFTAHHTQKVSNVAFSADDRLLLTVSADSTACIWDLLSRKLVHRLTGHHAGLETGAFSPDGKLVITGARENIAILWDAVNGKIIKRISVFDYDEFIEGNGAVYTVSFNKDGSKFLTGAFNGQCRLWNTRTCDTIRSFSASGSYIKVARFSKDNQYIIAGEWSGFDAYVWEAKTGKLVQQFTAHSPFQEYACLSSDNKRVLTALDDSTSIVYDLKTGRRLNIFTHKEHIQDAKFSNDGKLVITCGWDSKVKLWDAFSGKLLKEFNNHDGMVMNIALSPDGRYFATVSTDQTAKIWDIQNLRLHRDLAYPGYRKKDAVLFLESDKLVVDYGNKFAVMDARSINMQPEQKFELLKYTYQNDYPYTVREFAKDSLIIYNAALQPVLNISGYLSGYCISYTGRYVFITTTTGYGLLYTLANGKISDTLLYAEGEKNAGRAFSDNDSLFAVSRTDGKVYIWDLSQPKNTVYTLPLGSLSRGLIITSNNVLVARTGRELVYFDLNTRQLIKKVHVSSSAVSRITITADEKCIITVSEDKKTRSFRFLSDTAEQVVDHTRFEYGQSDVLFKGTSNQLVFTEITSNTVIWDVRTGVLNDSGINATGKDFRYNSRRNLAAFCGSTTYIWDLNKKKIKTRLNVNDDFYEWIRDARFSPDGNRIVLVTTARTVMFDTDNGTLISDFKEIKEPAISCRFSPGGDQLVISTNGFDYVYEMPGLKVRYTLLTREGQNYMLRTPDGFYSASPGIVKQLHYVTDSLRTIGFQQLDLKYNRPDKILVAAGNKDTALIHAYKQAHFKRLKKLGIDTLNVSLENESIPFAEIANRNAIRYEQVRPTLRLSVAASDRSATLQKFNVWVNDVPVYGASGLDIRSRHRRRFDTSVVVQLSQDENRIEVTVTNTNGIESYRVPLFVKHITSKPTTHKLYFIGIGINRFADSSYNLKWSVNDIVKLAAKLKEKYPDIIIDTLLDASVTKQNILALRKKLQQLDVDDKVILSYSGHGLLSNELDYYLSTYNTNFGNPVQNGLAYDDLEHLMDGIKPRRKLMLIDACHSGEVDKEEIERINRSGKALDSLGTTSDTANRSSITIKAKSKLGMANSFELMQNLFVNVSHGTGATIISAAGGLQYAQERGDLQGGVFTYSIIDAFNNHVTLTVSQLKKIVGESVFRLTNGLQKPTSRTETNNYDWVVW